VKHNDNTDSRENWWIVPMLAPNAEKLKILIFIKKA